jgi:hypothetical protein
LWSFKAAIAGQASSLTPGSSGSWILGKRFLLLIPEERARQEKFHWAFTAFFQDTPQHKPAGETPALRKK